MHTKNPCLPASVGEEPPPVQPLSKPFSQHFIRNGYTLSYWSSNQAQFPFLLSKNRSFYCHRLPHHPHIRRCRNLMQLNKSSLSPAPTQMYLISAEDSSKKKLIRSCLYMRYFAYRTWRMQQAKADSGR